MLQAGFAWGTGDIVELFLLVESHPDLTGSVIHVRNQRRTMAIYQYESSVFISYTRSLVRGTGDIVDLLLLVVPRPNTLGTVTRFQNQTGLSN